MRNGNSNPKQINKITKTDFGTFLLLLHHQQIVNENPRLLGSLLKKSP